MDVLKRFEFSAKLQRMSVIASKNENYFVFSKGSPEKIIELCQSESVPVDFEQTLNHYA